MKNTLTFNSLELDNIIAIILIGIIACTAMGTQTTDSQIVTAVVSGLIGYIAKGAK